MTNELILKFFGGFFWVGVTTCTLYGILTLFRSYRRINATVIKAHITAYKLQKMVEGRSR